MLDVIAELEWLGPRASERVGLDVVARILGDERNYAGGSWVTPDMFGSYRYGSELLDVAFDPTVGSEAATLNHEILDDAVERQPVIEALLGERNEVGDGVRRFVFPQLQFDFAVVGGQQHFRIGLLGLGGRSARDRPRTAV